MDTSISGYYFHSACFIDLYYLCVTFGLSLTLNDSFA